MTLNVNVPDHARTTELRGIRATRLGGRHRSKPIVPTQDPKGGRLYWIGPSGAGQDAGEGTDFHAIAKGLRVGHAACRSISRATAACRPWPTGCSPSHDGTRPSHTGIGMTSARTRDRLVQRLREQGITDLRVLERIRTLPRHIFVDEALASRAYEDTALPIGWGQTISQPYIVARMTEALLQGGPPRKVLEIGTGCGYQTAVLAPFVEKLYSIERVEPLVKRAKERLRELRDPQRQAEAWRRHEGLADARPLRRHPRRRGPADDSGSPAAAARAGWPADRPGGSGGPATAVASDPTRGWHLAREPGCCCVRPAARRARLRRLCHGAHRGHCETERVESTRRVSKPGRLENISPGLLSAKLGHVLMSPVADSGGFELFGVLRPTGRRHRWWKRLERSQQKQKVER